MRLLAGAIAAYGIPAVLDGSSGLRRRPMKRIVEPLQEMGVPIQASPGYTAPLQIAARPQGHRRPRRRDQEPAAAGCECPELAADVLLLALPEEAAIVLVVGLDGVPISRALEISGDTLRNVKYKSVLRGIVPMQKTGESLDSFFTIWV